MYERTRKRINRLAVVTKERFEREEKWQLDRLEDHRNRMNAIQHQVDLLESVVIDIKERLGLYDEPDEDDAVYSLTDKGQLEAFVVGMAFGECQNTQTLNGGEDSWDWDTYDCLGQNRLAARRGWTPTKLCGRCEAVEFLKRRENA